MKPDNIYNTKEGFDTPPEHIPVEEDLDRLASGDSTVIPGIINGLIKYATNVVSMHVERFPASKPFQEDLIAEAMLTLSEFVRGKLGASVSTPPSFLAQVGGAIRNNTNDWSRENENTIKIPARTQQKTGKVLTRHEIKEYHIKSGNNDIFNSIWAEEFTDTLDHDELLVARLRMEGASVNKIATSLGFHRGKVQRILSDIRSKYQGE